LWLVLDRAEQELAIIDEMKLDPDRFEIAPVDLLPRGWNDLPATEFDHDYERLRKVLFDDADVGIDIRRLMFPPEPWAAEDLNALFRHFDDHPG
jgi:hypothetical protein